MSKESRSTPVLPPDRAYVVQLRPVDQLNPQTLTGRVEHIASGRVGQFGSLDELLEFLSGGDGPTPAA